MDPERLIKGFLGGSMGGKSSMKKLKKKMKGGVGFGAKAAIGMGILGVALGATEHFLNKRQGQHPQGGQGFMPQAPGTQPYSPPGGQPGMQQGYASPGYPPQGYTPHPQPAQTTPPPPPPPPPASGPQAGPSAPNQADREQEAVLLLRSMIAAAHADGVMDADERNQILQQLQNFNLEADERALIGAELLAPVNAQQLAEQTPPNLAAEVYAAALLAVEVDTDAEQGFLNELAQRLALDPQTRNQIHVQFDEKPLA